MKRITSGLTPAEFLAIVNQNLDELADARGVAHYTHITVDDDYVSLLNTYFGESVVSAGPGSKFKPDMENYFLAEGCILDPSNVSLSWSTEYLNISFTDNTGGAYGHQIWESLNGGAYSLVTTLAAGVTTYAHRTWQNSTVSIKVRGHNTTYYSDYSSAASYTTPRVFRSDQSTLRQFYIKGIGIDTPGKSVVFSWGDGNTTTVTTGAEHTVTYDYTVPGTYWVTMTGDLNYITYFELYSQSAVLHGTNVDKWRPFTSIIFSHNYANGYVGNLTEFYKALPSSCVGCHFGGNYVTVDISQFTPPTNYWDYHFSSSLTSGADTGIYGDLSALVAGSKIAHFGVSGYAYGDLTNLKPWVAPTYSGAILDLVSTHPSGFTGDLSGWSIYDFADVSDISAYNGCHFTDLPRGAFRRVTNFDFRANSVNQTKLDAWLAYVDNYFTGGVVPLVNAIYRLSGIGMGIPSAAGLASIASIQAKYTAQGKTATITVNS